MNRPFDLDKVVPAPPLTSFFPCKLCGKWVKMCKTSKYSSVRSATWCGQAPGGPKDHRSSPQASFKNSTAYRTDSKIQFYLTLLSTANQPIQYPLFPELRVAGSAGASPSCYRAKAEQQYGQVAISSQGHIEKKRQFAFKYTPGVNIEFPLCLTWMCLDCGRNP